MDKRCGSHGSVSEGYLFARKRGDSHSPYWVSKATGQQRSQSRTINRAEVFTCDEHPYQATLLKLRRSEIL